MSSPKFQDLSTGSKTIVLVELLLFAGALLLTVYINGFFNFIDNINTPINTLFIYAFVFALVVQLSSLALGLYDSKLRENFRGVARRLLVAVAIGFFIVTLINPFYGNKSLPIDILAMSSLMSLVLGGWFRYITLKLDFFGFNKRKILVLGAGERASIIEKRMRRDVDRQGFHVHGFIVMEGDLDAGVVNENRIEFDGSLVN
jgi:FlaA1/EpsC-like NDP-sugar epimerase